MRDYNLPLLAATVYNLHSEQLSRQQIDSALMAAGWLLQDKASINFAAGPGIVIREYQTDIGPADYILFIDRIPVGVIEAKKEDEAVRLTVHEDQSKDYSTAKLKGCDSKLRIFGFLICNFAESLKRLLRSHPFHSHDRRTLPRTGQSRIRPPQRTS